MEIDQIAPGSLLGLMVLGLTHLQPGIDLGFIGMPGCELFASLDVLVTFTLAGPPAPFAFPIANSTSLVGFVLNAQGGTLTPGANPMNINVSNGLMITVGL
jgi:hypothetical protein